MNSAQLRLMQKRLAQVKQAPKAVIVDSAQDTPNLGPYVGHKAGKRKKGVSVLRKKPRASLTVTRYIMRDEYGQNLGTIDTLTVKPAKRERYVRP
jgi:hypothetical protein